MRNLISPLLLIFLSSCGNTNSHNNSDSNNLTLPTSTIKGKTLFAQWRNSTSALSLNLARGKFNSSLFLSLNINVFVSCDCFVFISGNESSGTLRLSQCFNRAGHIDDYKCENLNGYIPYSKSGSNLRLTCFNTPLCGNFR